MDIIAVCKDPGGINVVLPVVRALREKSVDVKLVANGKAVELLNDGSDEHVAESYAEEVLRKYGHPRVLVSSMCSNGGVGRDLVPPLRGTSVIVALQDFYGARMFTETDAEGETWFDPKYRPSYLVVNDDVAVSIAKDAWPDFPEERCKIFKSPAFDRYAGIDIKSVSQKVRDALGLANEKPIILVAGQGWHTAHMLEEVIECINIIGMDCYFVARPHPRTKDNYAEEMAPFQKAIASIKTGVPIFDFFGQTDTPSLVAAADIVISMFSTILIEAAILQKQNIAVLYPGKGKHLWDDAMGGKVEDFPLVPLGATAKAVSREDLLKQMRNIFNGSLNVQEAQRKYFSQDGKNAVRIADFIISLLRS